MLFLSRFKVCRRTFFGNHDRVLANIHTYIICMLARTRSRLPKKVRRHTLKRNSILLYLIMLFFAHPDRMAVWPSGLGLENGVFRVRVPPPEHFIIFLTAILSGLRNFFFVFFLFRHILFFSVGFSFTSEFTI